MVYFVSDRVKIKHQLLFFNQFFDILMAKKVEADSLEQAVYPVKSCLSHILQRKTFLNNAF